MSDYLKRLGTLAEYNTFKDSDDFVTPSVVYVDELDASGHHVHIAHETYKFGHVLMYDKVNKFKFGCTIEQYEAKYKSNTTQYEPQGLCVIPTGLLDNYARFISINKQTTKMWSTNEGATANSSDNFIYHDTAVLSNFTQIRTLGANSSETPVISNGLSSSSSETTGRYYYSRIPIERTGTFNTISGDNSNLKWYVESNSTAYYSHSLYTSDWKLNPWHFNNLQSGDYLKDQDGLSNTQALVNYSGVIVSNKAITYPAAEYCWDCYTTAVKQHSWYLPSITELSLSLCRYDTINNLLSRITGGVQLVSGGYWSSTEYRSYGAACFYTDGGGISYNHKYNAFYVRPFCRL